MNVEPDDGAVCRSKSNSMPNSYTKNIRNRISSTVSGRIKRPVETVVPNELEVGTEISVENTGRVPRGVLETARSFSRAVISMLPDIRRLIDVGIASYNAFGSPHFPTA